MRTAVNTHKLDIFMLSETFTMVLCIVLLAVRLGVFGQNPFYILMVSGGIFVPWFLGILSLVSLSLFSWSTYRYLRVVDVKLNTITHKLRFLEHKN
jgi:hypothetical protein